MPKNGNTVALTVEKLKLDYFNVRGETPATLTTWDTEYRQVYNRLPQSEIATEKMLTDFVLTANATSRQRRRFTLACSILAEFIGLEHGLRRLIGTYSPQKVNPRVIPDDETIVKVWATIPNKEWQYVYALMATYGLRNCECFLLDTSDFPLVMVGKSKRGDSRIVYPLYPEWFELFDLENGVLPSINDKDNRTKGHRVTKAFERYKLPFTPYNLRHAWARRSLEFGMDLTVASKMMGHSVLVHSKIYHAWLSKDVFKKAYDILLSNPNRPIAPSMGVVGRK